MPRARGSRWSTRLRDAMQSDATDPLRTVARRLGLRNGQVPKAATARRLRVAKTGAEMAIAAQEDAQPYLADGSLVMGTQSYFAPSIKKYRGDTNKVIIGSWCSVAADSSFYVGGMHPIEWVTTFGIREMFQLPGAFEPPMPSSNGDIVVGHDCWITEGTTILSGVEIGTGAVVATRAVVTRSVAPYTIVAGNPARVIGQRFSDDQIEALHRIAWWDWDVDLVLERVQELNGSTVQDFIERFDPG